MVWLIRRLRPWEGWDTFLPLLGMVLCLPAAVVTAEWVPGDGGLVPLALFALLMGRWLALRENWGWPVWLLLGPSYGLLAALYVAAHTLPLLPRSSEAASDFALRWLVWLEAALTGGTNDDPDIFLFYTALLCWGAILLVAWAFYRRRRPLLALLPSITLTALTVFYSRQGVGWLVCQLACGILLLALGNLIHTRLVWEATGVDYASGLRSDVLIVAGAIAFAVALFSLLGPQFSVRRFSDWFWRTFASPSTQVEETMDRLFGSVPLSGERPPGGGGGPMGASSYLPQSRLLGGRPDLLDEVVVVVWTDEPPPPPDDVPSATVRDIPYHYWRGVTLDHYSGLGWAMTVDSREEVMGDLSLSSPPAYREVTQRFEFTAPHGDTLYGMNTPVWVGEPVEALWRGPGDLARLASEIVSYTVISRLPTPTANDLRTTSSAYSDQIRERYLQLPETVPPRVIDLAWEVVADGETVYERARLLERYLRAYPYSLEVERPPEDRDVTDYFLFGVREGYCDYYATAFVVMARAVGIPARLASGYLGGQYDSSSGVYLVRQNRAHSWPEVYFPGWGWIGFEPTAARAVTELPEEVPLSEDVLPRPTGPPARVVRRRWRVIGLGLATLVGVGLTATLWLHYHRRKNALVVTLPLVWSRVGRDGTRLGLPPDPALTPREYAVMLAAELCARAERARRWQGHWMGMAERSGGVLEHLAALYTLHTYGGKQVEAMDRTALQGIWEQLYRSLRWFRWLGWAQRITGGHGTFSRRGRAFGSESPKVA